MAYVQEAMTIRNIRRWAITTLKKSDIEFPEINADTLLAHVLACDKIKIYTNPDEVIDDDDIQKYKKLIYKRTSHVPLQYITRHVEFMSLDFIVDERALIPRPETEILVETVLKKAQDDKFSDTRIIIMEIGTGSGNIAVSLSKNLSNTHIYTNDVSQDTLTLAKENVQRHDVADKVHLLHGNFFEVFYNCVEKEQVNFIISNPPYISESEWNRLEPEVKEYEPRQALVGGEDGFCFYRRIISDAHYWLRPDGYLVIEIGETQANTIIKLMRKKMYYKEIEIINDLQGKERVISARKK